MTISRKEIHRAVEELANKCPADSSEVREVMQFIDNYSLETYKEAYIKGAKDAWDKSEEGNNGEYSMSNDTAESIAQELAGENI